MSYPTTRLDKRAQLVRLRVEALEAKRLFLKPHEKWPTVKSVRGHRMQMAESPPDTRPPTKKTFIEQITDRKSGTTPEKPKFQLVDPFSDVFPFPITRPGKRTGFPQFSMLPAELRLKIWEFAVFVPRFIEAQYCTHYYNSTFINHSRLGPVFSICRESREVALSLCPKIKEYRALELDVDTSVSWRPYNRNAYYDRLDEMLGTRLKKWPNSEICFVPERDTIFLRSLDLRLFRDSYIHLSTRTPIRVLNHIQHLAIPFGDGEYTVFDEITATMITQMKALRTITFMFGCIEKSWSGTPSIELRNVEEWFADGRSMTLPCISPDGWIITSQTCSDRGIITWQWPPFESVPLKLAKGIKCRIVAWKRSI